MAFVVVMKYVKATSSNLL